VLGDDVGEIVGAAVGPDVGNRVKVGEWVGHTISPTQASPTRSVKTSVVRLHVLMLVSDSKLKIVRFAAPCLPSIALMPNPIRSFSSTFIMIVPVWKSEPPMMG
jgi:hypothetical protein